MMDEAQRAWQLADEIGARLMVVAHREQYLEALKGEGLITNFAIMDEGMVVITTLASVTFGITELRGGFPLISRMESAPD